MSEWTPYRITVPKEGVESPRAGHPLETVYHVVHVPTARRILEDGCLRAGLIYDESRLRKFRTCVTWLSANTWTLGSIYGNVQFSFPWDNQIRKRHCYWVEAMPGYNPHAYRILLTDRDLSGSKYVREYDPTSSKGPLRECKGEWFWNNNFTSEFMVESDIDLDECTGFDFVSHHHGICRLNGPSCDDLKTSARRTGGRMMAFLLGHDLHAVDHILKRRSRYDKARVLSDTVDVGVEGIWQTLGMKKERFGGPVRLESSRKAVLRGALALYGVGKVAAARGLVALLKSTDIFETALAEIVNEHFRTKAWNLPD